MNIQESVQSTESAILQGGTSIVFVSFLREVLQEMVPFIIVSIVLVFVDLAFGIAAARHRKEQIRWARAFRRTISKIFEYICWVMLSSSLAVACHYPPLEWVILGLVWGVELVSIGTNWYEIRDRQPWLKKLYNVALAIVGTKIGVDLSDIKIMQEEFDEEEQHNENK